MRFNLYSKHELGKLFLICVFPLHFWTILLALSDISWISERTSIWDSIGVFSYGLIFTFFESVFLWGVILLLGLLISRKFGEDIRIPLLGVLLHLLVLWFIWDFLYFYFDISFPEPIIHFLARLNHPLRYLYLGYFGIILITVFLPVYFIVRSKKFLHVVMNIIDRITLMSVLFILLNLVGLVIVIIRNI